MLYVIGILLIILGILMKKSKIIFFCGLLNLFILFGWSYGNADWDIHVRRYYYDIYNNHTELGFTILGKIFNLFNLDYRIFLITISIFFVILLQKVIKKYTKSISFVIILYFIYPFCFDVTMVRYTIASLIIILALQFYYSDGKNSVIKYILLVLLASFIHIGTLIFLVAIIPKFFSLKKVIFLTLVSIISILISIDRLSAVIRVIKLPTGISNKINIILNSSSMKYDFYTLKNYGLKIIINFIIFLFIIMLIKKIINHKNLKHDKSINFIDKTLKLNVILLIILPLLALSADLFRAQLSITLYNYIAIAQFFDLQKKKSFLKTTQNSILITSLSIIYATINLYLWILSSINIETVFRPLFELNTLF